MVENFEEIQFYGIEFLLLDVAEDEVLPFTNLNCLMVVNGDYKIQSLKTTFRVQLKPPVISG